MQIFPSQNPWQRSYNSFDIIGKNLLRKYSLNPYDPGDLSAGKDWTIASISSFEKGSTKQSRLVEGVRRD
jgi:hypothetical protein